MREFIQLIESEWTDEDQAASDEMDARYAREKKVEALIRHVFEKLGLEVAYRNHAINYDEESGRQCSVYLEGYATDVSVLAKLGTLGLGTDFKIGANGDFLILEFTVAEGMEHATPE